MSALDPPAAAVRDTVIRALAEDLDDRGDVTSAAVVPADASTHAVFVARAPGVLAGTAVATEVFRQVDPMLRVSWMAGDGDELRLGQPFGAVDGRARSVLTAERSALNFLTHCSGIATMTRRYVDAAGGRSVIRDTRKTLPGLRAIEKAAVRAGGGENHRESLSAAVLIKDNHLAFAHLADAVAEARAAGNRVVEVECDSVEQVAEAKIAAPDLVLLDNMTPDTVGEAVAVLGRSVPVEVSGGVTLDTVSAYAEAGATYISVGAITHSAPALDLALDILPPDTEDS